MIILLFVKLLVSFLFIDIELNCLGKLVINLIWLFINVKCFIIGDIFWEIIWYLLIVCLCLLLLMICLSFFLNFLSWWNNLDIFVFFYV